MPIAPLFAETLPLIDLAVIVVYLAGVVGLGCWFVRRSGNTDEFMAAGRSLPGWVVGMSIFGTFVSSISFLANPGKSYADNWNPFVFSLSLPVAAWIAVRWFVPHYRRGGHVSAYHHLEARFGPWARTYAAVFYLLTQVARVGSILFLVALALHPLTDVPIVAIILVTGVLVTVYTLLGGIEAVIWTDVVQSVVLAAGLIISALVLLFGMPQGPGQILTIAFEHDKFSLGGMGASLSQSTFWVVLVYGLAINLQNFGIDQSYVQRYIAARSDRDAARSVWLGALLYVPTSAVLFFIGTALFAFYTAQPHLLPGGGEAVRADAVFPHFIVTQLPTGMTGVLIAAILAAAMSSVDSSLNSSATVILSDFHKRYINPNVTERGAMRTLYGATLAFGVIGTGAALLMIRVQSVLDAWWKLAGVFSGGMLGLFLLGMIARRAGSAAAAIGVCFALPLIFWIGLSGMKWWPGAIPRSPLHDNLAIVFGTATILLIGAAVARLLPQPAAEPHQ